MSSDFKQITDATSAPATGVRPLGELLAAVQVKGVDAWKDLRDVESQRQRDAVSGA